MTTERTGRGADSSPRGPVRLLADPVFGPYVAGRLLATFGHWVHNVAAAIVVYDVTGSALWVGVVSVAQFGPQVVLAPWTGSLADRMDRGGQLVLGRLVSAAGAGGLAVWLAVTGTGGLAGPAPVIGAAFLVGVGFALGGPAMHALIPSLVRPGELHAAVALDTVPYTAARAAGPAAGAFLLAVAGPVAAFGVAAAGHGVFAVLLVVTRVARRGGRAVARSSAWAGIAYLRADPRALALLLGVSASGFGADPVMTLTPGLADDLGGGAELVGLLASAFGAGAGSALLVLGLLRRALGPHRLGSAGLLAMAAGLAVVAASAGPGWAAAGFAISGFGMTVAVTSLTALLQQRVPDDLRGRVMAVWGVALIGTRPVAAALNGAVADATAMWVALAAVCLVLVLGAATSRPSRIGRP